MDLKNFRIQDNTETELPSKNYRFNYLSEEAK